MSAFGLSISVLLVLAALVIIISGILYNRHLDKVARGEEHDVHSRLPEPGTTAGITYKTVLMVFMVVAVITVGTMGGRISSMQSTITMMQSELNSANSQLAHIGYLLEEKDKIVSSRSYEVLKCDLESNKVEILYAVELKRFSQNTKVSLVLNGTKYELTGNNAGRFSGTLKLDLFASYPENNLIIEENGISTMEYAEFPDEIFWEYLPQPLYTCRFDSNTSMGKVKYSGSYSLDLKGAPRIKSVTVTYISGDTELKTIDITKEALAGENVELEEGLPIKDDLLFKTDIVTTDGYTVSKKIAMIYEAKDGYDPDEYMRIYDRNGNLLFESSKDSARSKAISFEHQ